MKSRLTSSSRLSLLALPILLLCGLIVPERQVRAEFMAGATVVDVTPNEFPVLVNGGMLSRSISEVKTRVNARAIALSDGESKIVMVVVDSCMMPRPLLDEVKQQASEQTGVPTDHLLISATHTHTAPSCLACLGTDADPNYVPFIKTKLVEAIEGALSNLQPAQVGFGKADAAEFTALRRWIRRPDQLDVDPFGNKTVRANMHAARQGWDVVTGESGPEDPDLSVLSFQTADGDPLALLANFSMHYFGDRDISADYFGLFCEGLKQKLAPDSDFVSIMSHGCSGDIWRRDYTKPEGERMESISINEYADSLVEIALQAYQGIEYKQDVDLEMVERRMTLDYRVPDQQRLQWARQIVEEMGDRPPRNTTEVYAREQVILHERQQTEIVVQGLRIGEIGIATTPNETYAITGLKIKRASPLPQNIVIELANGGDGYIPPPEQHLFGGYNTWAARSAGLEVTAEPKIAEACIELLETVAGKPRKPATLSKGPAAESIQDLNPLAWWRLDELQGPRAVDSSGNQNDAIYEDHLTYFLEGPRSAYFCKGEEKNRAAMFVGGRVQSRLENLPEEYSVSLWFWNGMPTEAREVSGWLYSRGKNYGLGPYSEHLGIGGTNGHAGKVIYQAGGDSETLVAGKTDVDRWKWHHLLLVRARDQVTIYLDGEKELETSAPIEFPEGFSEIYLGGRSDNKMNWEGRLDEVSIFDRVLTRDEIDLLALPGTGP